MCAWQPAGGRQVGRACQQTPSGGGKREAAQRLCGAAPRHARTADRAGLKLLGFKPRRCLQPWHRMREATFVYPNDHALKGSTAAFVALHQRMLARDVVAVCSFVRSRAATPALVALAAAQEAKDEHGAQVLIPEHASCSAKPRALSQLASCPKDGHVCRVARRYASQACMQPACCARPLSSEGCPATLLACVHFWRAGAE